MVRLEITLLDPHNHERATVSTHRDISDARQRLRRIRDSAARCGDVIDRVEYAVGRIDNGKEN